MWITQLLQKLWVWKRAKKSLHVSVILEPAKMFAIKTVMYSHLEASYHCKNEQPKYKNVWAVVCLGNTLGFFLNEFSQWNAREISLSVQGRPLARTTPNINAGKIGEKKDIEGIPGSCDTYSCRK